MATATGKLLDSDDQPVAKRKLSYGIRVYMGPEKHSPWTETFGGITGNTNICNNRSAFSGPDMPSQFAP